MVRKSLLRSMSVKFSFLFQFLPFKVTISGDLTRNRISKYKYHTALSIKACTKRIKRVAKAKNKLVLIKVIVDLSDFSC